MGKKNLITAKQACKYLKLDSPFKVPICTIEPIICTNWFCKAKGFTTRRGNCNLNCFRNCAIKNPDAAPVLDIDKLYSQTITKLDELLSYYKDKMHPNQFFGGLIAYREQEILKAFYETPGAFSDVFGVMDLLPEDISFLQERDIKIDKESGYFIALNSFKTVLAMKLNQIINGDLIVYCTSKGRRDIENRMIDPETDEVMTFAKQGSYPSDEFIDKSECHHIMNFLPLKNYDLIKWCKINQFQREILQFDHYDIFKKIIKHIEETGLTGLIDANECYNLSYRPYMNAVYSLRNIRSHSMKFRRIARYYRNISINLDKYIQWLPFWDNSLLKFSEILRKDEYFIPKADIEESKEYPLHISKSTLLPSLMLWVFVTKNWEEICSPAWMRGRIFEDKIETELINRGVNILHKNLSLSPNDEVDFICEADGKYYVIEAKNYGPFWDYNYLSSSKYSARVDEINSKIAYAPRRLLMINANISKYGMPSGEKAQGIIITSFDEPGLIIPDIFIHITIKQFNKIFGKEKEVPLWKKTPIFHIPGDIMNKIKETHKLQ